MIMHYKYIFKLRKYLKHVYMLHYGHMLSEKIKCKMPLLILVY